MADVQFKYLSTDTQFSQYKLGYSTRAQCWLDANFIQQSGYWYDVNGTLHPAGSLFAVNVINDVAEGPSLGLANM